MSWTGRSEAVACCGDDPGPVGPAETIARLLHDRNSEPFQETFRREELQPRSKQNFSNVCGDADGFSTSRADGLPDDEIRRLAAEQAALKPGRVSKGAILAIAGDLRQIRQTGDAQGQVVYIYDDPKPNDPRHAVVRVGETVSRADFDDIRVKLKSEFKTSVSP